MVLMLALNVDPVSVSRLVWLESEALPAVRPDSVPPETALSDVTGHTVQTPSACPVGGGSQSCLHLLRSAVQCEGILGLSQLQNLRWSTSPSCCISSSHPALIHFISCLTGWDHVEDHPLFLKPKERRTFSPSAEVNLSTSSSSRCSSQTIFHHLLTALHFLLSAPLAFADLLLDFLRV